MGENSTVGRGKMITFLGMHVFGRETVKKHCLLPAFSRGPLPFLHYFPRFPGIFVCVSGISLLWLVVALDIN